MKRSGTRCVTLDSVYMERVTALDNGMSVKLYEKLPDGELRELEERVWSANMVAALEHVNYLVVGNREFETVEGRLNVDEGTLELLLVPIVHE
jgi:hypothetical protein